MAYNAVAAGQVESAQSAVGAEDVRARGWVRQSGESELDTQLGRVTPASFARTPSGYMAEFGTTAEVLALVAVKEPAAFQLEPVFLQFS